MAEIERKPMPRGKRSTLLAVRSSIEERIAHYPGINEHGSLLQYDPRGREAIPIVSAGDDFGARVCAVPGKSKIDDSGPISMPEHTSRFDFARLDLDCVKPLALLFPLNYWKSASDVDNDYSIIALVHK